MRQVVPTRYCKILLTVLVSAATIAAVLVIGLSPRRAVSLPLYARQTGQPCATPQRAQQQHNFRLRLDHVLITRGSGTPRRPNHR